MSSLTRRDDVVRAAWRRTWRNLAVRALAPLVEWWPVVLATGWLLVNGAVTTVSLHPSSGTARGVDVKR